MVKEIGRMGSAAKARGGQLEAPRVRFTHPPLGWRMTQMGRLRTDSFQPGRAKSCQSDSDPIAEV